MTFLAGILLCGLGCGICFAQYSSFEYAGVKDIGIENLVSDRTEIEIGDKGTIYIATGRDCQNRNIIPDDTVPKNKIIFDVTYNPEKIEMCVNRFLWSEMYENDQLTDADELYNEDIYIGSYKYASETEDFFEIKDEFLADFKKNRISAYNIVSIKTLDIRVNPADVQRIALR